MKNIQVKIISGKYKNQSLVSLSEHTRETSHVVRGAVFNMLYSLSGSGLDLFAGSGAYGFEALSRGLDKITLNDVDKLAFQSLKQNNLKLKTDARLYNMDYQQLIITLVASKEEFNYIFLDPPYHLDINPIIELVSPLLASNGVIIAEMDKSTNVSLSTNDLSILKERVHGIKKIVIIKNVK